MQQQQTINHRLIFRIFQSSLEVATAAWGVQVERVEVKDVRVPENLQRAMAAEAEAAREARAKVIAAEGEHKASKALRHAAEVIIDSPAALQVNHTETIDNKVNFNCVKTHYIVVMVVVMVTLL